MEIKYGQHINIYGDSFTVGAGSSSFTNKGYAYLLSHRLGVQADNQGQAGAGVLQMFKRACQATANVTANNNLAPIITLCGFNDAIRGGAEQKELDKIYNGYMAFFANAFANITKPASHISITQTGTWSALSSQTNHPLKSVLNLGGTALTSDLTGDTLTWTSNGSTLVIGFVTNDEAATGIPFSTFDVEVDGTVIETVDTNDKSLSSIDSFWQNDYSVGAVVYHNLGLGDHTVKIINKEDKHLVIDWVGTLNAPSVCPSIYVGSIPLVNDAAYAGRPYNPDDNTLNLCSTKIQNAISKFKGFPIQYVNVNEVFTEAGLSGDNIHPNDLGHSQICDAFFKCIQGHTSKNLHHNAYTDQATNNVKSFTGINARYESNGTFARYDTTKPAIGLVLSTIGASNTIGAGILYSDAGGALKYLVQWDKTGKDITAGQGAASLSGNGALTAFTITHGAGYTPNQVFITPTSSVFADGWYISAKTATTFTLTFAVAPPVGVNNIKFDWKCR